VRCGREKTDSYGPPKEKGESFAGFYASKISGGLWEALRKGYHSAGLTKGINMTEDRKKGVWREGDELLFLGNSFLENG